MLGGLIWPTTGHLTYDFAFDAAFVALAFGAALLLAFGFFAGAASCETSSVSAVDIDRNWRALTTSSSSSSFSTAAFLQAEMSIPLNIKTQRWTHLDLADFAAVAFLGFLGSGSTSDSASIILLFEALWRVERRVVLGRTSEAAALSSRFL